MTKIFFFWQEHEATKFLEDLAQEVHNRMAKIKVKAKTFTLKLKIRSPDAPVETAKFLGMYCTFMSFSEHRCI